MRTCRQPTQSWFRIDYTAKNGHFEKPRPNPSDRETKALSMRYPLRYFLNSQNIMRGNRANNRSINLGQAVIRRRITAEYINEARQY